MGNFLASIAKNVELDFFTALDVSFELEKKTKKRSEKTKNLCRVPRRLRMSQNQFCFANQFYPFLTFVFSLM